MKNIFFLNSRFVFFKLTTQLRPRSTPDGVERVVTLTPPR